MTLCREWSLVKTAEGVTWAKCLKCRSWGCEHCQPERRLQLLAQAAAGEPTRLLTLTVNPGFGDSPEHRRELLSHAWATLMKRLRRAYKGKSIEYFAVCEETKAGEPHLHILLRSPYIPQSLISEAMRELINAPIVDVRRIQDVAKAVRYVAKYVAKAPARFGTFKRYWHSKGWEVNPRAYLSLIPAPLTPWTVLNRSLQSLVWEWSALGIQMTSWDNGTIEARPPPGVRLC